MRTATGLTLKLKLMIVIRTKSGEQFSNVGLAAVISVSFVNTVNDRVEMNIDDLTSDSSFYSARWWKAPETQYTVIKSDSTLFLTGDSLESIKTTR